MKKKILVIGILLIYSIILIIGCGKKESVEHETIKEGILTGQSVADIADAIGLNTNDSPNITVLTFDTEDAAKKAIEEHENESTYLCGNVLIVATKDAKKEEIHKYKTSLVNNLVTQDSIKDIVAKDLKCDASDIEFSKVELDTAIINKYWYVEGRYKDEDLSYKLDANGNIEESSQIAKEKEQTAQANSPSDQNIQDFNNSINDLIQNELSGLLIKVESNDVFSDYTITVVSEIQYLDENDKQQTANKIANKVQDRAYGYGLSSSSSMIYMYYQNGTKFAESKWTDPRTMDVKN